MTRQCTQAQDGVIKFDLEHTQAPLPRWAQASNLQHWFRQCRARDLLGQHADRYGGAAYGNISQRAEQGFLITGTQTGGWDELDESGICWVREIDLDNNRLVSLGPIKPSSESMTHEQVYQHVPDAGFVIHVHHKPLWLQAKTLGLPITAASAEYGTPEMAHEVERLLAGAPTRKRGAFSMGGHEDGIVVFGSTADECGERLLGLLEKLG